MGFRQNIPCGSLDYDDCVRCRDQICADLNASQQAYCLTLPLKANTCLLCANREDCQQSGNEMMQICEVGGRAMCLGGSAGGIIKETAKDIWRGIKEWF